MTVFRYQVCLLGNCSQHDDDIKVYLIERLKELGLSEEYIVFLEQKDVIARNRKAPCAVVFSGYPGAPNNLSLIHI